MFTTAQTQSDALERGGVGNVGDYFRLAGHGGDDSADLRNSNHPVVCSITVNFCDDIAVAIGND